MEGMPDLPKYNSWISRFKEKSGVKPARKFQCRFSGFSDLLRCELRRCWTAGRLRDEGWRGGGELFPRGGVRFEGGDALFSRLVGARELLRGAGDREGRLTCKGRLLEDGAALDGDGRVLSRIRSSCLEDCLAFSFSRRISREADRSAFALGASLLFFLCNFFSPVSACSSACPGPFQACQEIGFLSLSALLLCSASFGLRHVCFLLDTYSAYQYPPSPIKLACLRGQISC